MDSTTAVINIIKFHAGDDQLLSKLPEKTITVAIATTTIGTRVCH
jgi:hypothetical protein